MQVFREDSKKREKASRAAQDGVFGRTKQGKEHLCRREFHRRQRRDDCKVLCGAVKADCSPQLLKNVSSNLTRKSKKGKTVTKVVHEKVYVSDNGKSKPKAKGKAAGTQYYAPYTPPQETKKEAPKEEQKKPDVNRVELSMKFIDKMLGEMEKKNEAIAKNAFFNVIQPTALKTSEKSNEMTL